MLLETGCLAIGPTVHCVQQGGITEEQLTVCVAEKGHAKDNGHMWMLIEECVIELKPIPDASGDVFIRAVVWGVTSDAA